MEQSLFPSQDHPKLVRWATYTSVSVSITLIAIKWGAWQMTGALSLQATLVDSLLDALASLINLIAVRQAQHPPTKLYRFGHGKAEALAALIQSLFVIASAGWLMWEVFSHLKNPDPIAETAVGIGVMVVSMVLTFGLLGFQRYVVKLTGSTAIHADSVHYRCDFLMNGGVILSLILVSWLSLPWIDSIIGGLIALYILYSAWEIVSEATSILMDKEFPENERKLVVNTVMKHPDARGLHDLRTRKAGPSKFIQFHLELEDDLPLRRAHDISEEVEGNLLKVFPHADILIHQDPASLYKKGADKA